MDTYNESRENHNIIMQQIPIANTIGLNPMQQIYQDYYHGALLEIGPGNGSFTITLLLNSMVKEATLVDISDVSKKLCEQSLAKWGLSAICVRSAIEEYETTEKFDTIVFWEGLEHVIDIDIALAKICSLISNDGWFIGSVPNEKICYHETHKQIFTIASLSSLLKKYFLDIEVMPFDLTSHGEVHLLYKACKGII